MKKILRRLSLVVGISLSSLLSLYGMSLDDLSCDFAQHLDKTHSGYSNTSNDDQLHQDILSWKNDIVEKIEEQKINLETFWFLYRSIKALRFKQNSHNYVVDRYKSALENIIRWSFVSLGLTDEWKKINWINQSIHGCPVFGCHNIDEDHKRKHFRSYYSNEDSSSSSDSKKRKRDYSSDNEENPIRKKVCLDKRIEALGFLGLQDGATEQEITKMYRKLLVKWHPDKNNHEDAENVSKGLIAAYEALTDEDAFDKYSPETYIKAPSL